MAHSLRLPLREPQGVVDLPGETITIYNSPTGNWQRLERAGEVSDYRIDYVIGSGNHASGYLVDLGGHLFQSPVTYYRSRQDYDVAPGYEGLPFPDFTRPVGEGCLFCHSGTALHVPGSLNQYRSPVFSAKAITCERCHGPVEKHLADPRAGTIVNPAKLEPAARDSVCEQCHLFGVSRVLKPGKDFSDFLPGQRLEDTFTVYHNALPAGTIAGPFKVISQAEQLALGSCARNSSGRMWCGTCHDPHDEPRDPVQFYRSRCFSWHTSTFSMSHPGRNTNCIGCHMPRRQAKDGGHTSFTDHRIQRRPQAERDLPADADIAAWREPSANLRKRNLGIAYIDVGIERRSQSFIIRGYRELADVQNEFASDSELFSWMGQALLLGKQFSEAELAFDRALELRPDSPVQEANVASAYAQAGDLQTAMTHLERAVALDPLYLPAAGPLITLYRKEGKDSEAEALSAKIEAAMRPVSRAAAEVKEPSSADHPLKMAEEVFKNIQALKGAPVDQLIPAMEFMTSSLGVDCAFCHVPTHFEKDDKKPKEVARNMMRMVFAINQDTFEGQRVITCYSCHHGSRNPLAVPALAGETEPRLGARTDIDKLPGSLPTAAQLIDRYVQAVGGASAIQKIASRFEKGVATFNGDSLPIEIFAATPGKLAILERLPNGESITTFDGHAGCTQVPIGQSLSGRAP
jgi:tetratricopeptide (TPR) repeat protein